MKREKKLWWAFILVVVLSFSVLLYYGYEIYQVSPPIPEKIVDESGELIFTEQDIKDGQNIWQSIGGQEVGSIWGHGAYVAPDWTADWLHREAIAWLDLMALERGAADHAVLDEESRAALQARLRTQIRVNTFDADRDTVTIAPERAAAIATVAAHYNSLFGSDPALLELRKGYAMKNDTVPDAGHRQELAAFVWWTAWSAVTQRPGQDISFTANWPFDPLVGNEPPSHLLLWTVFSVLF